MNDEPDNEQRRIGRVRLQAVRVHRQLAQLRGMFHRLEPRMAADHAAMADAIRALAQKLDAIDHEVGSLHERARLLLDEVALKMTETTNRRLFTLSVLTACLLPPTLVIGFFGMNTKDLPWQNTDGGTWFAFARGARRQCRELLGAAADAGILAGVEWATARPCGERPNTHNAAPRQPDTAIMILEIAQIDVKPGMEKDFEAGVKSAGPMFKRAKGCKGQACNVRMKLPPRYRLFVQWETLENHTMDFRGSADFQEWRKLVGHCFAAPPNVEHVTEVMRGF